MFKIILFLACSGLLLYANRKYIPIGSRVEKSSYTPPKPDSNESSYPNRHWTNEEVRQIREIDKPNIEYVGPAVAGPVIRAASEDFAKKALEQREEILRRLNESEKKFRESLKQSVTPPRPSKLEVMKEQLFLELAEKHKKDVLHIESVCRRLNNTPTPLAYINSMYDIKLTIDDVVKINGVMEREKWM